LTLHGMFLPTAMRATSRFPHCTGQIIQGAKHTMLTVRAKGATAKDISNGEISLAHHFFDHSLNPLSHYCSPPGNLPPLLECPELHRSTCRTHPSKTKMLHAITAPGPRLLPTALLIGLHPTSTTPVPQRSTIAAPVPTLRSLSSVGSLRSRKKGHGTAWPSPGDSTNMPVKEIESNPLG
jgi:hypothetical protein